MLRSLARYQICLETYIAVDLSREIRDLLNPLKRQIPALASISSDFAPTIEGDSLFRLERFNEEIRAALNTPPSPPPPSSSADSRHQLKPSEQKALNSFHRAQSGMVITENSTAPSQQEIWQWINDNDDYEGGTLPEFQNWARYLRSAQRKSSASAVGGRENLETPHSAISAREHVASRRRQS